MVQPAATLAVTVRPVRTGADLERFLALPDRLYAGDPSYVAPLRWLERRRLRAATKRFEDGQLVLFLAERGGEVVGTISALADRGFQKHHDKATVWFGYFETVDDPAVSRALLDAVAAQAEEWGAVELRGPRNLSRMEYMGLSVDGFDRLPPMLQGHHPAWYQRHLEAFGLAKHHDHYAYEASLLDERGGPRALPEPLASKAAACDIPGLTVRRARWRSIESDLRACHAVLNAAYTSVPDVSPMPLATWMALGRTFLAVFDTELLQIAFVGDQPVAFAACMPEINHAVAATRGRVLPAGWLRFVRAMKAEKTGAFKLIGVNPEYRGSGLHAVLIANVIQGLQRAGYTRLDASIIDERNKPMRAVVEHTGCTVWRTYRVYTMPLPRAAS